MTKQPTPGTEFHFLKSGMAYSTDTSLTGGTTVSRRGQTGTITQTLLDANVDRNGHTFFELLHDEDAQINRWGEIVFAPGPAPADLTAWTPGTVEEAAAREAAHRVALALSDDAERRRAVRAVNQRFSFPTTQVSTEIDGGRFR